MADKPLFDLTVDGRWRLAYDKHQWIVQQGKLRRSAKAQSTLDRASASTLGYRGVQFIGGPKEGLWHAFRKLGILLTEEAIAKIDAMPDSFLTWLRHYDLAAWRRTGLADTLGIGAEAERKRAWRKKHGEQGAKQGAEPDLAPEAPQTPSEGETSRTPSPAPRGPVQGYGPLPDEIDMPPIPDWLRRAKPPEPERLSTGILGAQASEAA